MKKTSSEEICIGSWCMVSITVRVRDRVRDIGVNIGTHFLLVTGLAQAVPSRSFLVTG